MEEEWRDISGYEGRYKVSNFGRVKTVERHKTDGRRQAEAVRITEVDRHGYEFALLFDGERYHRHSVHVLVAKAFIPNEENKPQVNHIDGNKLNNVFDNLEWATASENQRHAIRIGLTNPKHGNDNACTKISDEDIRIIRERRAKGEKLNDLANEYGVSFGYIGRVARGERRKYA